MNTMGSLCALALLAAATAAAQDTRTVLLANRATKYFELDEAHRQASVTLHVSAGARLVIDVTALDLPSVTITNPLGQQVPPANLRFLTLAGAEAPPLGAAFLAAGEHVQLETSSYSAGDWVVALSLPVGMPATRGLVQAAVDGGIAAAVVTAHDLYPLDATAILSTAVVANGQPVVGASVTADIYREGQRSQPVLADFLMLDSGAPPDAAAGDGLYTAAVAALPASHYVVEARIVRGADDFTASTTFEVRAVGHLTGRVEEMAHQIIDINGVFVDRVDFRVDVRADGPGNYDVEVVVEGSNGATVRAVGTQNVAGGTATIIAPLSAQRLREDLGVDGPYEIREVRLVWHSSSDTLARHHLLGQSFERRPTNPYRLYGDGTGNFDLQRPSALRLFPGFTESTADLDADGLIDELRIAVTWETVDLLWQGLTAELRAADGTTLTTGGVAGGFVSAGVRTTTLTFSGSAIGGSGKNGPYEVANLTLYDEFDAVVADHFGETQPYSYTQFEDGSAQQDNDVDGVPNSRDNCRDVFNPDQRDTNGDGFGNVCDGDLDQSCLVQFVDLGLFKQRFFSGDDDADLNGDGFVNFLDLGIVKGQMFQPPGPSGLPNDCD